MRFILGLTFGALLTLLAAEVTGIQPRELWQSLQQALPTQADATSVLGTPELPEPVSTPPLPAASVLDADSAEADEPAEPLATVNVPDQSAEDLPAVEPLALTTAVDLPEDVSTALLAEQRNDEADTEVLPYVLWVPFYSQASAEGFAEHLTATLSVPFSVRKRGAGDYVVVFNGDPDISWTQLQSRLVPIIGPQHSS